MILSVLVALILTPALCATLLKPIESGQTSGQGFFGRFNRGFDWTRRRYSLGVGRAIARSGWTMDW